MQWTKFTININESAEEDVSYLLSEMGIDSVEIEDLSPVPDDIQGGTFAELQPDRPEDNGRAKLHFYVDDTTDQDELLSELQEKLEELRGYRDIGLGEIEISVIKDEDYANNWKEFFHSFTVGNIFVKPTWEDAPLDLGGKTLVEIDPGMSFGTGKHESTQLIIEKMDKYLKEGDEILDVGCGSGILSIIALKTGAAHAVGTDIDPDCITSVYENFEVNRIPGKKGDFYTGNLIDDEALLNTVGRGRFPLVFANILADIIIAMAPALYEVTAKDGVIMTSGIIDFKEDEVDKALTDVGFKVMEHNSMGEWRSIIARK